MNKTWRYLREHPWQRRMLTVSLTLGLSMLAIVIAYPYWETHVLVRDLGSRDPEVRERAIRRGAKWAQESTRTARALEGALDDGDDLRFFAAATALNIAGLFNTPARDPLHIDRARAIELSSDEPETRELILAEIVAAGRDNRYVRRALASVVKDADAGIRARSALLAAMLADDASLAGLLCDDDPSVRAAAALDAGIAGRGALAGPIEKALADADSRVVSAAAFALASLDPGKHSEKICKLLAGTPDEALRDRLLHVAARLGDEATREAVRALVGRSAGQDGHPPAMAILAAGKLKLSEAAGKIRAVLAAATEKPGSVSPQQLRAAVTAADMLGLPVHKEVNAICRKWWGPRWHLMLISAARLLGRQAADLPADSQDLADCRRTLLQAAIYPASAKVRTATASAPAPTPVPSAAAAVAHWLLAPSAKTFEVTTKPGRITELAADRGSAAALIVMDAARADTTLAGDYIAWHLARSGRPEAFELGLKMLPALDGPPLLRVYNENLRGAGAMLLALSARTPQQKRAAVERITLRLEGGRLGGEDSPVLAGTYRCALLVLGRKDLAQTVREQRDTGGYPLRTAVTALCAAGEAEVLQWLLLNTKIPSEDLAYFLVYKGLGEVVAGCAPQLPTVDPAADEHVRLWQARILQDYYAIRRTAIRLGPAR